MRVRIGVVVLVGALVALTFGAIAIASQERPLSAADVGRAMRAAVDAAGGGTAVSVDRDLEGGATWEVEVILPDGSHVDVLLDARFQVLDVGPERDAIEPPQSSRPPVNAAPRVQTRQAPRTRGEAPRSYEPRYPASRYSTSDDDLAVSPEDWGRAAEAALAAAGGGTILDVDRDLEAGATWEVEIRQRDGRLVDVLLDARFDVLDVSGEQEFGESSSDHD